MTKVSALSNADLEPRITTEAIVQKLAEAGVQAEKASLEASTAREVRLSRALTT
jgi:hypothetical protein